MRPNGGLQERSDTLTARIAEDSADVPMEEGMAEIDSLVARERARRFRRACLIFNAGVT